MNKSWIKVTSLAIAAVMALSACAQTASSSGSKDQTGSGTSVDNTSSAAPEKVHKLRLMGVSPDKNYFKFDEKTNFPSWQLWEDAMKEHKFELTYDLIMPDQYSVVLQTMFASQADMPDMVFLKGMDDSSAMALANNGQIIDVNAAIKQYSDGTIQKLVEKSIPFYGKAATAPDGKRYWLTNVQQLQYIPNLDKLDEKIDCPYVIGNAIRVDWLDKFNLQMPKTLDEYVNALKTFRDKDANGNGKQDEILMFDPYSYNFYNGIAQWFGLPPALMSVPIGVDMYNKKVVCAWDQPGAKAYFQFMRKLVDAGVFDTSMIGASDEQCNQAIAENRVSSLRNYSTGLAWEQMISQDKDATELYMIVPPIQTEKSIPAYSFYEPAQMEWEKYAITSKCQDVEGAIKLLDYYFSEDGRKIVYSGKENVDFKPNDVEGDPKTSYVLCKDGTFVHPTDVTKENPVMTDEEKYNNHRGFAASKWLGDIVLPRIQIGVTYFNSTDARNSRKQAQQVELMQSKYYFPSNSSVYYAIATTEESAVLEKYAQAYATASEELSMQLILGQKSLDNWDAEVAKLKSFGADDVLKVYQSRYQRYINSGK